MRIKTYRYMIQTGLILRCSCDVSTEMRAMGVFALVSLKMPLKWGLVLIMTVASDTLN